MAQVGGNSWARQLAWMAVALAVAGAAQAITPAQQAAIRAATFEVVIPKPKDDPLSYEKPLPFELLPYRERTDAWNSIGTAFALGGNRYVTAGHVLQAAVGSQGGLPALRGSDGVVHALGKVLQFSAFEDFGVFSLADDPAPPPFETNREPAIDDAVYAVGNALGEGVVIRDGLYTSATPEDQDGRWKWIRFSAAASPGNSGGPLLDASARVIGIVIGKSANENLNYALPIGRVLDAPAGRARYDERSLVTLPWLHGGRTWSYQESFALPLDWPAFQQAHQALLLRQALAARAAVEADHAQVMFPRGAGTEPLLYDGDANDRMPWFVAQQADGSWGAEQPRYKDVPLPGDGAVLAAPAFEGALLLRVVRPGQASDDAFYADSSAFMDLALKALDVRRHVGSDAVRVTSAGKAQSESVRVDRHGRRWQVRSWALPYIDGWILTAMLPTPDGYGGVVLFTQSAGREPANDLLLRSLDLMQLSYRGTLAQWQRFFARQALLPDALRAFRLEAQPRWRLVGPRFEATVPTALFDPGPASVLDLTMGFRPDGAGIACEPTDLWWYRDRQWRTALGVHRRQQPPESARVELHNAWHDLQERAGSYDGRWSREGADSFALSAVFDVPAKAPGHVAADLLYAATAQVEGTYANQDPAAVQEMLATALVVRERATGAVVAATPHVPGERATLDRLQQAEAGMASWAANEPTFVGLVDARGHTPVQDLHAVFALMRAELTSGKPAAATSLEQYSRDPRATDMLAYWKALADVRREQALWKSYVALNHLPAGTTPPEGVHKTEVALAAFRGELPDAAARDLAVRLAAEWRAARNHWPAGVHVEPARLRPRSTACPAPATRTSGSPGAATASSPDFGEDYYPAAMKRQEVEGSVLVTVHITETGCVDQLGIAASSGSPELDEAALAGAEQISYFPAERDGKAVDSTKSFRIQFRLKEPE